MKQFARSVPVILFLSVASLSLIALAGCGSSGSGSGASGVEKSLYVVQETENTSGIVQSSVLVFSASATGSTTPTSTLTLPSGFVGSSVAVGPQGQIYVAGFPGDDGGPVPYGQILEYPAGSSGSATPSVTLNGVVAGGETFTFPYELAVNSAGTLFVSSEDGSLEAYTSGFTGASAPSQYLTWGLNNTNNISGAGGYLGADAAGDIFYLDSNLDSGVEVVDVFAAGATGATAPARTITGTNTNSFSLLENIAVDGAGDVYLTNYNSTGDTFVPAAEGKGASVRAQGMRPFGASRSVAPPLLPNAAPSELTEIIEFAAGATGNATPLKRIGGTATNIVEPEALAVDAASNLYYVDANGGYWAESAPYPALRLEVFPASASGNVPPTASMTSAGLTVYNGEGLAVY